MKRRGFFLAATAFVFGGIMAVSGCGGESLVVSREQTLGQFLLENGIATERFWFEGQYISGWVYSGTGHEVDIFVYLNGRAVRKPLDEEQVQPGDHVETFIFR